METRYFKFNHYHFCSLCSKVGRATLWAYKDKNSPSDDDPPLCYLGKIINGKYEPPNDQSQWDFRMRHMLPRLLEKVATDKVVAIRSTLVYNGNMARKDMKERNKLIVDLKDNKNLSFSEIALMLNMKSKSSMHTAYNLAKGIKRGRKSYQQPKACNRSTKKVK